VEITFDVQGVEDTIALLRKIEPDSLKAMRKEIVTEPGLTAAASAIRSRVPTVSPLQGNEFGYGGMIHNGRTSYRPPTVKIKSPLNTRMRGRNQKAIVFIDTVSPKDAVGFEIIDMVGRGPKGNTRKAQGMKEKLVGNPSRYVWKGFEEKSKGIEKALENILERYAQKVNVRLRAN
jgi:hypothetical protein